MSVTSLGVWVSAGWLESVSRMFWHRFCNSGNPKSPSASDFKAAVHRAPAEHNCTSTLDSVAFKRLRNCFDPGMEKTRRCSATSGYPRGDVPGFSGLGSKSVRVT